MRIDYMDNRKPIQNTFDTCCISQLRQSLHLTSFMFLALEFWILFFFPTPKLREDLGTKQNLGENTIVESRRPFED
jgi:hypothetical protein